MSTVSIALLVQLALSCSAASSLPDSPGVVDRIVATAQTESGLRTTALHDNTTGQTFSPATDAEAITLAVTLRQQGHSFDAGLMQINERNWRRLKLTAETVFEPRRNVCAGIAVLAEAYATERRVSCRYNTGRPDCINGYPEKIDRAISRIKTERTATASALIRGLAVAPTATDPFIKHGPVRELMVASPSGFLAPPVPAVPDLSSVTLESNQGALSNMRSLER